MNTLKFKEGDWIKRKKDGRIARVVMLLKTFYDLELTDGDGWWLDYDFQDNWELTDAPHKNKLEEAAFEHLRTKYKHSCLMDEDDKAVIEDFIAGAKWQKKQDDLETEDLLAIAHLQGMEQQKAKMMERAVEGVVQDDGQFINFGDGRYIDLDPTMGLKPVFELTDGDKVKVIVIKEEK